MIESIISYIDVISGGNQMIAGGLTVTISGAFMYLVKALPAKIISVFKSQMLTTLEFNNTDYEKRHTFIQITQELLKYATEHGSRRLTLDSYWSNRNREICLTLGIGNHILKYKGKWLLLQRETLDSSGSEILKENFKITYIGRSHKFFNELVEDFKPKGDYDKLKFFKPNKEGVWVSSGVTGKRGLDTLALNEDVKQKFKEDIKTFLDNEDDFIKQGLPYKLNCILHGITGSGKTSLLRALASEFDLNLCILNINQVCDSGFEAAVRNLPERSLLVIEDFDSCGSTHSRVVSGNSKDSDSGITNFEFLSLTGILNALDGVIPLDGSIIFLTTNHLEKIDPAITRAGRIDKIYELPKVDGKVVKSHLESIYGKEYDFNFPDIDGKDINMLKLETRGCPLKLKEKLGI